MLKCSWIFIALVSIPCVADEDEYQQCLQRYLPNTELDGAAVMVRQTCSALHHGGIMLPREEARLQCQLDTASSAKTAVAFEMLMDTCDEEHSFQNAKD